MEELLKLMKFYRGEKRNPYDNDIHNRESQFWEYEAIFCHKFLDGSFGRMTAEVAFKKYLDDLFVHLADRYETMDGGRHFRDLYNA